MGGGGGVGDGGRLAARGGLYLPIGLFGVSIYESKKCQS